MQNLFPETTRFAPSPSGRLHLGHAHAALIAAREAEKRAGRFLLRIEDIDTGRCRQEFEAALYEDLAWLGLSWEHPVLRQSERFSLYREVIHTFEEGGIAYPCFCTRKEIIAEIERAGQAPHGPDGPLYPGTCRALSRTEAEDRIAAGKPYAIRLRMDLASRMVGPLTFQDLNRGQVECQPERFGDIVLGRKDVPTSYHVAATVDDAAQHVSLVTRGEDLLSATDVHRLLQSLLGLPEPTYLHHGLIRDEHGKRLAKRDDAKTLASLRAAGSSPAEVRALAGLPD